MYLCIIVRYMMSLNLRCIEAKVTTKSAIGSVPSSKRKNQSLVSEVQFQVAKKGSISGELYLEEWVKFTQLCS